MAFCMIPRHEDFTSAAQTSLKPGTILPHNRDWRLVALPESLAGFRSREIEEIL